MTIRADKLSWPIGWPRTPASERINNSAFKVTPDKAYRELRRELLRLADDDNIVISSNMPIRLDGMPYAEASAQRLKDPGVAVYFTMGGKPMAMARDAFILPGQNVRSLGLAVEALRAVERHGGSYMMARSFQGFAELPAPGSIHWSTVLKVPRTATRLQITEAYLRLAQERHPDKAGGSDTMMAELNAARDQALAEVRS